MIADTNSENASLDTTFPLERLEGLVDCLHRKIKHRFATPTIPPAEDMQHRPSQRPSPVDDMQPRRSERLRKNHHRRSTHPSPVTDMIVDSNSAKTLLDWMEDEDEQDSHQLNTWLTDLEELEYNFEIWRDFLIKLLNDPVERHEMWRLEEVAFRARFWRRTAEYCKKHNRSSDRIRNQKPITYCESRPKISFDQPEV